MESKSAIELVEELAIEMKANEEPRKAINMAAYLKNHFACYGIKSPIRKEIQTKWITQVNKANIDRWDIVYLLWDKDQREFQYIAIDYLNRMPKKGYHANDYLKLEELITTKSWWDSVDSIASNYVGDYFKLFPEQMAPIISRWRKSDNMWLNRTCLIFQLKYKNEVDFELLKDLIRQFQPNKEFFIQKAIGWSLRQYSKYNPKAVAEFVDVINLQGLARREAIKYV